jgi:hypothetical protein
LDDRRGDWEHGVDESLVALNAAQRSTDKEIDDHDLLIERHERILVGDPEEGKIGISAEYEILESKVNALEAEFRSIRNTIYGDRAGGHGHEQRLNKLEDKRESKEKRVGYFWAFVTSTVGAFLMVASLMILNWDRVEEFARKAWEHIHHQPVAQLTKTKHKAKRQRKKELPPIVTPDLNELSKPDTQK